MRTIVLSLVTAIADDTLTEEDLGQAIFCLEIPREYVLDKSSEYIRQYLQAVAPRTAKISTERIELFMRHLRQAEAEDRVVWRRETLSQTFNNSIVWQAINAVFQPLGLHPLPLSSKIFIEDSGRLKTAIELTNEKLARVI